MSYQATEWALRWAPIPPDERGKPSASSCSHVLLALAYPADEDGRNAFPAVETIADWTHLSERTIRAALGRLHKEGLIRPGNQNHPRLMHLRSDRRPKVWDLMLKLRRPVNADGVQSLHPAAPHGVQPSHPVPDDGVQPRPNGVQPLPERGAATAPKESLKSPERTQEQPAGAGAGAIEPHRGNQHEHGARQIITEWRSGHEEANALRTTSFYTRTCKQVADMLAENLDPVHVVGALMLWDQRPHLHSPGILPNLYDEAVRTAAARIAPPPAAPTSARGEKVRGWLALGETNEPNPAPPVLGRLFGAARANAQQPRRLSTTDQRVADAQALKERMRAAGRFDNDPDLTEDALTRRRAALVKPYLDNVRPARTGRDDFLEGEVIA